jgi:hypothetical protein
MAKYQPGIAARELPPHCASSLGGWRRKVERFCNGEYNGMKERAERPEPNLSTEEPCTCAPLKGVTREHFTERNRRGRKGNKADGPAVERSEIRLGHSDRRIHPHAFLWLQEQS